jgi:hypothetical protein
VQQIGTSDQTVINFGKDEQVFVRGVVGDVLTAIERVS